MFGRSPLILKNVGWLDLYTNLHDICKLMLECFENINIHMISWNIFSTHVVRRFIVEDASYIIVMHN